MRTECLAHAITHREADGIWGGTTPIERGVIVQRRCVHCSHWFRPVNSVHVVCSKECRYDRKQARRPRSPQ